jgi:hypothetical protein
VATDYFAQADDGSVWYFGEDVANYEDGTVADHDGSWLAGRDGPPGMIMPANPQAGDVYRSENIPGLVFEQDTVRSTTATVDGPRGPVQGAALVEELLMDGTVEEKAFAPGYGEFRARAGDELVTVALALPVDGAGGSLPGPVAGLVPGARSVAGAAAAGPWPAAAARADAMAAAWARVRSGVPELLAGQMTGALAALTKAVRAHHPVRTGQAALRAEQAALDLRLRHRPPATGRGRPGTPRPMGAPAPGRRRRQGDRGAVAGDVATLQVLWDRAGHATDPADAGRVTAALAALRAAVDGGRGPAPTAAVVSLRDALGRARA